MTAAALVSVTGGAESVHKWHTEALEGNVVVLTQKKNLNHLNC